MIRFLAILLAAVLLAASSGGASAQGEEAGFRGFVEGLWPDA